MTVSIIIPCFNAGSFLCETIVSALNQRSITKEVIVIDDGSTDNSQQIACSFGKQIRLDCGPNRGVSEARNRGTELARGDFIQYLDADDLLLPGAIQSRVEKLEITHADVAYSDWQELIEGPNGSYAVGAVHTGKLEGFNPDPALAILQNFWAPPAALLYRRKIVKKIGAWNTRLPIIQDARFLLDAALHGGEFVHVSGVSALYRRRVGSLSQSNKLAFNRDCLNNALEVLVWWRTHGGITPERNKALVAAIGGCARSLYEMDHAAFDLAYAALTGLTPGYCPPGPPMLRFISRLIGYRRAEAVAYRYRRFKKFLKQRQLTLRQAGV